MEGLLQVIIPVAIIILGAVIMFLAGAVYATPAEDPNETIEYLKSRINALETREHLRILEDRELMLELMHGDKKKEAPDKKLPVQTKWVS
jgi:hypothetical protein